MTFPYDKLAAAGFHTVEIRYAGSGDEGFVNEIIPSPLPDGVELSAELYSELEERAYDVLEGSYAGWEINEGSSGSIKIDVPGRKAQIEHGWVVESTRWDNKEVR